MRIKIIILFAAIIVISSVITGCQSEKKVTEATETTEESGTSEKETIETSTAKSTEVQKSTDVQKTTEEKKPIKVIENTEKVEPAEKEEVVTEGSARDMLTTEGYVLRVEGSIMYLDEVNTGGRTYGDEGQDRATAYDLSNAVINAPGGVRSGLTVDLIYYIENGINKALEVNSDGDEKEPMAPYVLPEDTDYENET